MRNRSVHIVSASLENDIHSIAELLSPVIGDDHEHSNNYGEGDWAIGDDDDSVIEPSIVHGLEVPVQRLRKLSVE